MIQSRIKKGIEQEQSIDQKFVANFLNSKYQYKTFSEKDHFSSITKY